ncbi:CidA/LrgA family protein [Lachnoclostridium sp. Marseille-P6806]|uniref:CidA/LrgA family protein n=1 Tax=Lachnoclostridium sp. Marseille-P6806 TaxID=2364793 RepID=UPI00103202D7|nr:CidA/LrgA family protein [Lachnoclostridium sp. Marseille-P6806]
MRYLFQFIRMMAFCFLGEMMHWLLPFPIPASIYGLVLLIAALKLGIVCLDEIREVGNFLTGIFPILFVPAAAGVMNLWGQLRELAVPIGLAVIPITAAVMAAAGRVTQVVAERRPEQRTKSKMRQ